MSANEDSVSQAHISHAASSPLIMVAFFSGKKIMEIVLPHLSKERILIPFFKGILSLKYETNTNIPVSVMHKKH